MPAQVLRTIDLNTIPDAIHVMNESSKGTSLEYHLDFFGFLALQGYWNFSSAHSLIRYIENEPVGIILVCADSNSGDAHILYWGVVAKFRTLRLAQELFEACCERLTRAGFTTLYGVSVADRPVRRYRFIRAMPQHEIFDMHAKSLHLPAPTSSCKIRPMQPAEILQIAFPDPGPYDWSQRPTFLLHAAPRLRFIGAVADTEIKAYAVVLPSNTDPLTLVDLRSSDSNLAPGYELLRHVFIGRTSPYLASNVFKQSYCHRLLTGAGFEVKRQFFSLVRDLRSTSATSRPA